MKLALVKIDNDPQFPSNLAILKAVISLSEHQCVIIDATFIPSKTKQSFLFSALRREHPDVIGLGVTDHDMHKSLSFAHLVKGELPDVKICLGGPMPTLIPHEILSSPDVDALCIGDGENIPAFLSFLEGKLTAPPVGFIVKDAKGNLSGSSVAYRHENLDALPFIKFEDWDIDQYRSFYMVPAALPLVASRGCVHQCRFCISDPVRSASAGNKQQYYRVRSPRSVMEEIAYHLNRLPGMFSSIYFEDALFGQSRPWFDEFVRLYREHGYHEMLPWSCETRADIITRKWAQKARSAGCVHVRVGVETWNEDYRRRVYAKQISNKQFSDAARALHEEGIYFNANMIVGGPGETLIDSLKSFFGMLSIDPLYLTFSVFRLTPGTSLYDNLKEHLVYRDDLPRLAQKGMPPVLGDILADIFFPAIQRIRSMSTVLHTPLATTSWTTYLLNKDGCRIEPLFFGRKNFHTLSLQQRTLSCLINARGL